MCIQTTDPDHPDISCVGCRDLNIARGYMYPHVFKIPVGAHRVLWVHTYKVYSVNAGQTCTKCKAKIRVFDEKNCATRDWTHLASVGMGHVSRERTVQELCPPTNHTL